MTKQVQRRRGTATQHTSFTGAEGEISVNTTNKSIHVHDGVTAGGIEGARADMTNVSDGDLNSRLTGNTLSSLTITSADINGGTIDGTVIGGSTPAAGSFTTGSFTGNVSFGDNDKAIFGAGSDLQIYHDGVTSVIQETGSGDLRLKGTNIDFKSATNETYAYFQADGPSILYHNSSDKLATTASGIDVTGTVTADGLTVAAPNVTFSGGNFLLNIEDTNAGGSTGIRTKNSLGNETTRIAADDGDDLSFYNTSSVTKRMEIGSNGDISFYEDTGTTPKFFWDASAERLGIGTSIPTAVLDVRGAAYVIGASGTRTTDTANGNGFEVVPGPTNNLLSFNRSTFAYLPVRYRAGVQSWEVDNVERMRIDSSGNVGIGTSSPWEALSIPFGEGLSFGSATYPLTISRSASGELISTIADGYDSSSARIDFVMRQGAAAENTALSITGNGNVGIGTDSPIGRLEIANSDQTNGVTLSLTNSFVGSDWSSGDVIGAVDFRTDDTSTSEPVRGRIKVFDDTTGGGTYPAYTAMSFSTATVSTLTERMRIDSSGNVGIGTSSPSAELEIASTSPAIRLTDTNDSTYGAVSYNVGALFLNGDQTIRFNTNGSEAMRIDSSGNLLVGTTTPEIRGQSSIEGFAYRTGNSLDVATTSGLTANFNRMSTDGDIVAFRKDGSVVGSIGSGGSSSVYIGGGDTGLLFAPATNIISPWNTSTNLANNGNLDLGYSGGRFKDLYLSGGVYLGGTGSANKLDDYEEGQWEVVITGETSGSVSTGVNGNYVKVGNMVTAAVYVNATLDLTSISGVVNISLPLAALNWHGGGSLVYANNFLAGTAESDTYIGLRPLGARVRMMKGSSTSWLSPTDIETASGQKAFMMHVTFQV